MTNVVRWTLAAGAAVVLLATAATLVVHTRSAIPPPAPQAGHTVPASPSSATTTPSAGTSAGHPAGCAGGRFVATANGGSTLVIVLRNVSDAVCTVGGYPGVAVTAHPFAGGTVPALTVAVRHGTVGGHPDPGTRTIDVAPHGAVSFALGITAPPETGTRYVVTELRLTLPGDPAPVRVPIDIQINVAAGTAVPVVVTALVAGTNGP